MVTTLRLKQSDHVNVAAKMMHDVSSLSRGSIWWHDYIRGGRSSRRLSRLVDIGRSICIRLFVNHFASCSCVIRSNMIPKLFLSVKSPCCTLAQYLQRHGEPQNVEHSSERLKLYYFNTWRSTNIIYNLLFYNLQTRYVANVSQHCAKYIARITNM